MFYSARLSFLAWSKEWVGPLFASASCYGLLWAANPPRQTPEAAYIFLFPVLIWFHFQPNFKKFLLCIFLSGLIYQFAMVGWIRHVSFGGMCATASILSCYHAIWFAFARLWYPHFSNGTLSVRLLYIVALSALWVAIEWARTLFTLGFPWCPLSVTQWERPVLLQTTFFTGGWAVSFFLIFFNLCLGSYLHHLVVRRRCAGGFLARSVCPELYLGILLLFLMVYPYFLKLNTFSPNGDKTIRVGICQPYLTNKWQEGRAMEHKEILRKQTQFLAMADADLILWPEASTPYPLNLDRLWAEELARQVGIPILAGSVIREEDTSYNAMVYIDPLEGISPEWYAKQVLVPFGEYVPWPFNYLSGLKKLIGPVGNFSAGDHCILFNLPIKEGNSTTFVRAGLLICYEDIFPAISRIAVDRGAELLIVSTNNAWFKEEGCAEQHAAHSVMRAVENNIPVVRCGNAGWSGLIDENGIIRDVLKDEHESVYFQGASVMEVPIPSARLEQSTSMGDRFAYLCCFLFIAVGLFFHLGAPRQRE